MQRLALGEEVVVHVLVYELEELHQAVVHAQVLVAIQERPVRLSLLIIDPHDARALLRVQDFEVRLELLYLLHRAAGEVRAGDGDDRVAQGGEARRHGVHIELPHV